MSSVYFCVCYMAQPKRIIKKAKRDFLFIFFYKLIQIDFQEFFLELNSKNI